jgi:hypothetical protein
MIPFGGRLSKKQLEEMSKQNMEQAEKCLGLKINDNNILEAYVLKCTTLSYHMLINEPYLFQQMLEAALLWHCFLQ